MCRSAFCRPTPSCPHMVTKTCKISCTVPCGHENLFAATGQPQHASATGGNAGCLRWGVCCVQHVKGWVPTPLVGFACDAKERPEGLLIDQQPWSLGWKRGPKRSDAPGQRPLSWHCSGPMFANPNPTPGPRGTTLNWSSDAVGLGWRCHRHSGNTSQQLLRTSDMFYHLSRSSQPQELGHFDGISPSDPRTLMDPNRLP
jgi:hypothetical protein